MNEPSFSDERLRDAFAALAENAKTRPDCPAPDRIWAATRFELAAEERQNVIEHTSSCAACAEAWRVAHELQAPLQAESYAEPAPAPRPFSYARWGIAAALLLFVGGTAFVFRWIYFQPEDTYRNTGRLEIRSLLSEEEPLPKQRFLLRWSPGPEGSQYDVHVTTDGLEVLALAEGVDETQYLVPGDALRNVASGAAVLWQVEAVLPGGARLVSQTFIARVR